MDYRQLMLAAIEQAKLAGKDVPVGAVLVDQAGQVIARGFNQKEALNDPTSHAEIEVIREAASKLGSWRLDGYTLIVTLEPCVMCAGAIVAARIPRVVFGAWDERVGASGSAYDVLRDPRLGAPLEVVSGIEEEHCKLLLTEFFKEKRV